MAASVAATARYPIPCPGERKGRVTHLPREGVRYGWRSEPVRATVPGCQRLTVKRLSPASRVSIEAWTCRWSGDVRRSNARGAKTCLLLRLAMPGVGCCPNQLERTASPSRPRHGLGWIPLPEVRKSYATLVVPAAPEATNSIGRLESTPAILPRREAATVQDWSGSTKFLPTDQNPEE